MKPEICLAPLKGITDAIFRTTYAEFFGGIDWTIAPFLTTLRGAHIKPSHLKQVLPENNRRMPVVPQILSKTADHFVSMATALYDLGYEAVNWNLGCPFPMVAKKGRGSGMLPDPQAVQTFLDQALPLLSGRFSIKMRLGRHRAEEIERLLPVLAPYPIEAIIIHPRTGVQMYNGRPDLDAFERCLSLTNHKVIYNGDIVSRAGFTHLQARFPRITTWMIGRGVMRDPFLPAAIKGQTLGQDDCRQQYYAFHETLFSRYASALFGPSHLLDRMKGLWSHFSDGLKEGQNLRKRIHKTRSIEQYCEVVKPFLSAGPVWEEGDDLWMAPTTPYVQDKVS
jgi:tRNA-dihydrouridine synthase B